MGTIKLDTITPLSNTNDITIASNKFVGTASGTMTVVGEGGTTQTSLQQVLWLFTIQVMQIQMVLPIVMLLPQET